MPTVLIIRNTRIVIYANDHRPPLVYALRKSDGAEIAAHLEAICAEWSRIHG